MIRVIRYIIAAIMLLLLHIYFYNNENIERIDYKFYDFTKMLFSKLKQQESSSYSVIVDIDEKSLNQLGQWPWPRVIDAKLIDMINLMNPSALGVNILFPERDRTSPISMQEFYKNFFDLQIQLNSVPKELKDNDKLLSDAIQRAGATLSTYFNNGLYTAKHCQELIYKRDSFTKINSKFRASSLLCNHKTLQDRVENFGFINAWVDSDGVFRRIPMFMKYKNHIFPSFSLATLLSFDKYIGININTPTVLVDFSNKKTKVFSAVDVLNGKIKANEIRGKVVIIGSSVVGLNPTYITSSGKKISNSMIHATVIDNILGNSILTQPQSYKTTHLFISFSLSILTLLFFFKKFYIHILILSLITISTALLWLINGYIDGVYISIGYLLTPFFLSLFSVLIYQIKILIQKKQQQEKLLIRQSKLISMGEIVSLIAHQWRQPLSAINGVVLTIDLEQRKNLLDSKRLNEHLDKIEQSTAYLSDTIDDFTNFFSTTKEKETFYITDIIAQAKNLIAISNHKDIEIIHRKQENIKLVGYKSELIQSLLIIMNNAIYACQKNLDNIDKGKIVVDTYAIKDKVFISVEDNGGGIESSDLKKIFNPYFTTKKRPHGTGLGLYILKLIIEDSMNGKISIINNPKKGATFIIQISINIHA